MPNVDAFVITPVSAHSLTHRPLVVRDTSEIDIAVVTDKEEAFLSVDGQSGMPLRPDWDAQRQTSSPSLALARLLVELMGGALHAESRVPGDPTHGTAFVVTLPCT